MTEKEILTKGLIVSNVIFYIDVILLNGDNNLLGLIGTTGSFAFSLTLLLEWLLAPILNKIFNNL